MTKNNPKLKPKSRKKRSLVPLWLALGGLALVLLAGWAILNGNPPQPKAVVVVKGAPRLQVEKDVIDHGDLKLGNPIKDEVRVTNIGDQPLRFSAAPYIEVKEGC
jgi:hypothetical protein